MKISFSLLFISFGIISIHAQSNNSRSLESPLQFDWNKVVVSQSYANHTSKKSNSDISKIKGSPYIFEFFLPGTIALGDSIYSAVYLRHNAYNDEMELKINLEEEEVQSVLKDSKIVLNMEDTRVQYIPSFKDLDGKTTNGYMYVIYEGSTYKIYTRKRKILKKGKEALTSFESSFPDRFEDREGHYISVNNKEPMEFKVSEKNILNLVEKGRKEEIKDFIKAEKIDLNKKEDLVRLMTFVEKDV